MCQCAAKIAKLILFLINFAVFVCGAVFLGVGIALAVDEDVWDWFSTLGGMDDGLLSAAVYMMISVGVLLFLVGFLGCCGSCKGNKCMLQTYIILVAILLCLQLTAAILALIFKDSLTDSIKEDMTEDIQTKYQGVNNTDALSISYNSMQNNLKCCGANNFTDYQNSTWKQTNPTDAVPITCCKGAKLASTGYYTIPAAEKATCMTEAGGTGETQLYRKGCYDGLGDWIDEKSGLIAGILMGLGALQLAGIIGACCIKGNLDED